MPRVEDRPPIDTTPVAPIGTTRFFGQNWPVYPETDESRAFQARRHATRLTAKEAADRLGIMVRALNELESGGRTCDYGDADTRLQAGGRGRR